jgi:hypothetical protein
MSKYVPAFAKQQQSQIVNQEQQESNGSIWNRGGNNRFAALSDDFPMNKRERPATMAPVSMMPATMASLTSSSTAGGGSKSFASKFSEQMRRAEDPTYVPPPKPLNMNSQDDFPTLGGMPSKPLEQAKATKMSYLTPSSTPNKVLPGAPLKPDTIRQSVISEQPVATKPNGNKWASMAKAWAQQDEDEKDAEHEREVEEERQRREMELLRSMPLPTFNHNKRYNDYNDYDEEYDEDDEYHKHNDKDSFVYESSDTEDGLSDNDKQDGEEVEGEFNSNTVWDGRRKDDLY